MGAENYTSNDVFELTSFVPLLDKTRDCLASCTLILNVRRKIGSDVICRGRGRRTVGVEKPGRMTSVF
jgi:hypothetical protein